MKFSTLLFLPVLALTACADAPSKDTLTETAAKPVKAQAAGFWVDQIGHGNQAKIILKRHDGTQKVLDDRGLVSHIPVIDSTGKHVAYQKSIWKAGTELNIVNIDTGERSEHKGVSSNSSSNASWGEQDRALYMPKNGLFSRFDVEKKTFTYQLKYQRPESFSASPDGKYVLFMKRSPTEANAKDDWQLYLYDVNSKQDIRLGTNKDKKGAYGPFFWSPSSDAFLIGQHHLDDNGKVIRSESRWFSKDLKSLDKPKDTDMIYHPQHYPHVVSVEHAKKEGLLFIQ